MNLLPLLYPSNITTQVQVSHVDVVQKSSLKPTYRLTSDRIRLHMIDTTDIFTINVFEYKINLDQSSTEFGSFYC